MLKGPTSQIHIDINIKCGNSLVSRFALNTDLSKLLKKSKWTIETYRNTVSAYRNETNSLVKSQMSDLISTIKESFSTNISRDSKEQKQLRKLGAELYNKFIGKQIFDENLTEKQQEEREKEQEKLEQKIAELEARMRVALIQQTLRGTWMYGICGLFLRLKVPQQLSILR